MVTNKEDRSLIPAVQGKAPEATTPDFSFGDLASERAIAMQVAKAVAETKASIMVSKANPRNMNAVFQNLMIQCERKALAEKAEYRFPRGGKDITGKSVYLARVAAQCYQNILFGFNVLREDEDSIVLEGFAWDMENNVKVTVPATFGKLIQRKNKQTDRTEWIKPDERDLRELVNKQGAVLVRNCILQVLPADLTDDAVQACRNTIRKGIQDPEGEKKNMILKFGRFGVTVEMLNEYLGTEVWTVEEILELTQILETVKAGQAKLADYFPKASRQAGDENDGIGSPGPEMVPGDVSKHTNVASGKKSQDGKLPGF